MVKPILIYAAYVAVFAIFFTLILAVPIASFNSDQSGWYQMLSATCHQKISRSLCIFSDFGIGDCTSQSGIFIDSKNDRIQTAVIVDGKIGYKMPVCARDFGLYGAILLTALIYPLFRKIEDARVMPVLWLILAIVPLALDGGVQMLSDLGWVPFAYESTNLIRVLTGVIAGGAASVYAIPLLMNMFGDDNKYAAPVKGGGQKSETRKTEGGDRS